MSSYSGDGNHYQNVLERLFVPAIEAAGMDPVPPIAEGDQIIHGSIIKNLESADLVLCDFSSLNPNVLFELGIRTAVNRPVALVKDDLTSSVPFDLNVINHHIYASNPIWTLDAEIEKLKSHLAKCGNESKPENSLWAYFGMNAEAAPLGKATKDDGRWEYLATQVEALRREVQDSTRAYGDKFVHQLGSRGDPWLRARIENLFRTFGIDQYRIVFGDKSAYISTSAELNADQLKRIDREVARSGRSSHIRTGQDLDDASD